jgi:hypothetical protein
LDSRLKIVSPEAAVEAVRAHSGWIAVTGYFDPLTAAHANRLREIRSQHSGVVVFLSEPAKAVLPARARAELIAALRAVDAVAIRPLELAGIPVIHEEPADEARFADLVRRVHRRCAASLER